MEGKYKYGIYSVYIPDNEDYIPNNVLNSASIGSAKTEKELKEVIYNNVMHYCKECLGKYDSLKLYRYMLIKSVNALSPLPKSLVIRIVKVCEEECIKELCKED